jgi:hypothetical protein
MNYRPSILGRCAELAATSRRVELARTPTRARSFAVPFERMDGRWFDGDLTVTFTVWR